MMTIEELFKNYRDNFVEVYAEVVGLELVKPVQIFVEESNILAHLAQFTNKELTLEVREQNLIKAEDHLIRAALDLQKLLWASLRSHLDNFIVENPTKILSFNLPKVEVVNRYKNFINEGRLARKHEMKNVGNDPFATVEKYKQVNYMGLELLSAVDIEKLIMIKQFELKPNIEVIVSSLNELKEALIDTKKNEEIEEIEDIQKSLEKIEDCNLPEEVRKSSAINKVRRFIESANNPSSTMGTAIKTIKKSTVIIQEITKYFDKIVEWYSTSSPPS